MKNNWSKHSYQEDEDVLKYGSRLNSELNIKNIKANFDRNAIIMEDGRAYIWGGE